MKEREVKIRDEIMRSYNIDPLKQSSKEGKRNSPFQHSIPSRFDEADEERSIVTPMTDIDQSMMIQSFVPPQKQRFNFSWLASLTNK